MGKLKYFSVTKRSAPEWQHVKFKGNCKVVDPLGAGDICLIPVNPTVQETSLFGETRRLLFEWTTR